jgi:hypothetical protein
MGGFALVATSPRLARAARRVRKKRLDLDHGAARQRPEAATRSPADNPALWRSAPFFGRGSVIVCGHMNTPASHPRTSASQSLRVVAQALAPYVAEELLRLESLATEALDPDYDARTCRRLAGELSDAVLGRAATLFEALAGGGVIDSVTLADRLGVSPRALSGNLTTPLKRRAKALGLPLPFDGGHGDQAYGGISLPSRDMDAQRTHWRDRNGIAERMLNAVRDELRARRKGRAAGR